MWQNYALKFELQTQLDALDSNPAFHIGDSHTIDAGIETENGIFNREEKWFVYATRPEQESEYIGYGSMTDKISFTVGKNFVWVGEDQVYLRSSLLPLDEANNEIFIGFNQIIIGQSSDDTTVGQGLRSVVVYALKCDV